MLRAQLKFNLQFFFFFTAVQTAETRSAQVPSQSDRYSRRLQSAGSRAEREQSEHVDQRGERHFPRRGHRPFRRTHSRGHEHKRFRDQGTAQFGQEDNQLKGKPPYARSVRTR